MSINLPRLVTALKARPPLRASFLALLAIFLLLPSVASATSLPATITEDTTLAAGGNPYTGATTIESGVTLKAEPGVEFRKTALTVKGTLLAEGTAEEVVVFTESVKEGKGITFEPGSGSSVLDHVEITYMGSEYYTTPAIAIKKSSPTITNATINHAGFYAIEVYNGGSPKIANDVILNSGGYGGTYKRAGIYYHAEKEDTGDVNIHDNYIEKCGGGIQVGAAVEGSVTATALSGNTLVGNEGTAFSYSGPEVPGDVTENTLIENTSNYLKVGGTVASSSTWKFGGNEMHLTGLSIAAGVTLKMAAGVYLANPNITVKGTLLAEGTAEEPVVFTESTEKGKGITFEPGSGSSVLDHVEITYMGSEYYTTPAIAIKKSSPTITNATINHAGFYAIEVYNGGSPKIANDVILNSGGYGGTYKRAGIYYHAEKEDTGDVNIHDNYIEKCGGGIQVGAAVEGSVTATALSGNTLVGNEGTAFSYSGPEVPGDVTENTLIENTSNYLKVGGTVASSSTWKFGGNEMHLTGLSIAAGVTLKMAAGVYLANPNITVKGTLLAEGTAEEPVVFTESTEKGKGITFEPGSGSSVLDHVEITYMGSEYYTTPAIAIKKSSPTITNATINHAGFYAIEVYNGGSPKIANDVILNSGGYGGTYKRAGIYYHAEKEDTGDVNIHDNYIEKCGGGIQVGAAVEGSVTATALSGNTLVGNEGTAFSYSGPEVPGDVTENTLIENTSNYIQVGGTVAKSSTWKDGGSAVLIAEVTIASGVTLKVSPNVYLENPAIIVKGTLIAEGTSANPVVLTGKKEASAGEWKSIIFEPGSGSSVLDHVEIAYGGKGSVGMVEAKGSHPTIRNSTIRKSAGYGVKVTESGSPTIEWNRFRSNSNGLSYAGTGKLSAPNNDWNCVSGPKPSGCGDSVTANVDWKPAVQLPELAGHCRGESQCGKGADPVSLATGQLAYSHRDLLLTNKSEMPLEFSRSYSSGSESDTGLGPGWAQSGLASASEQEDGDVLVVRSDGRQDLFEATESGYKAPSGITDVLVKTEAGTFELTTLQNTVYEFDESGRIALITDDHGLKTTYTYDANGRLATITDPSAQTLTFTYSSSNHITKVKDSTGREVEIRLLGGRRPRIGHRRARRRDQIRL